MKRLNFKMIWARKRRVLSSSVAVIIGIAFLTATLSLGNSMTAGMESMFTDSYANTDVEVRSEQVFGSDELAVRAKVPADMADRIASLDEVAEVGRLVSAPAQLVGSDNEPIGGNGPPTLGEAWDTTSANGFEIVEGRAPQGSGEVAIDANTAELGELAVGDVTTVRVPQELDVEIVGIADFASGNPVSGVTITWFETEVAQDLFMNGDEYSAFSVVGAEGVSDDQVAAAVDTVASTDVETRTNAELVDDALEQAESDFLGFFRTFLLAFAGIALFVAVFSISNTFSILVAQRTRESALMRAIGASRGQVLRSVAYEALAIGIVASLVGIGVGVGLTFGLNALISAFAPVPTVGLGLTVGIAATAAAIGVGVTFLASLLPARRASKVAPLAALRDVATDNSGASIVRTGIGAVVGATGAAMVIGPATYAKDGVDIGVVDLGVMQVTLVGALALFVGAILLGPFAARIAAGVIGAPIATVSRSNGKLARRNALRNPKRTSSTATALLIGTAIVALFATFGASIKQSMTDLVDEQFGGDLVIEQQNFSGPPLDPALRPAVENIENVDTTASLVFAPVKFGGNDTEVLATQPASLAQVFDLGEVEGSLAEVGVDEMAISAQHAEDNHLDVGSTIDVTYPDGQTVSTAVAAIYESEALFGPQFISVDTWSQHVDSVDERVVFVDLVDGASIADTRPAIDALADAHGDPAVQDADEFLDAQGAQIDTVLTMVYVMLGLAVLIAVLGIANTLSLSLHERTRELGLLRAIGQTRRSLRATVRWESIIVAVFGTAGGIALGTFAGWGLMKAIAASEDFGSFALPVQTLGVVLIVAIVAGVLAAARPARRASKLDVLQAIATD